MSSEGRMQKKCTVLDPCVVFFSKTVKVSSLFVVFTSSVDNFDNRMKTKEKKCLPPVVAWYNIHLMYGPEGNS